MIIKRMGKNWNCNNKKTKHSTTSQPAADLCSRASVDKGKTHHAQFRCSKSGSISPTHTHTRWLTDWTGQNHNKLISTGQESCKPVRPSYQTGLRVTNRSTCVLISVFVWKKERDRARESGSESGHFPTVIPRSWWCVRGRVASSRTTQGERRLW